MTATGASIAEDEKRPRPIVPTFPDIGATAFFANGVEALVLGLTPHLLIVSAHFQGDAEPRGKGIGEGGSRLLSETTYAF